MIGKVEMSGKVIEHENGYRAERARVVALLPFRGQEWDAKVLARAYRARVSHELSDIAIPTGPVAIPVHTRPPIRQLARATVRKLGGLYLFLLAQVAGLISKGVRGVGLLAGIGVIAAVGVALTAYAYRQPRGGRAARPTNPIKRIGVTGILPGPRWWHDRPINGVFRLPAGR
jgi:hypothetical protein